MADRYPSFIPLTDESVGNVVEEALFAPEEEEEDEGDEDYEDDEDDEDEETEEEEEEVELVTVYDSEPAGSPRVSQTGVSASVNDGEEENGKRGGRRGGDGSGRVEGEACSTSGSQENEWNRSEVDGLFCPICMEAWTSSGDHHICCLPCGHIYGFSCINKWLGQRRSSGKCPQCNRKCSLKDVRKIFASRIAAVDEESHKKIRSLETKLASIERKDADWGRKEAEWKRIEAELRSEVSQLRKRTMHLESLLRDEREKASGFSAVRGVARGEYAHGHHRMVNGQAASSTFFSQGELEVTGARLFDIDASSQILLLARRLPGMGGTHVLTQMSLIPPHESEDILLPPSTRAIKDLHISPNKDGLALFGSLGKKLSVISMHSHNVILAYDLPINDRSHRNSHFRSRKYQRAAAWSCSWDINSSHHIYAGLQNGMLLIFDMRQTTGPLASLSGLSRNPIHSLHSLSRISPHEIGPVLSASSIGLSQWNIDGFNERPSLVPDTGNPGVCISSAYCPFSDSVVLSYRPRVELPDDAVASQPSLTPSVAIGSGIQGSHVHFRRGNNDSYQITGSVNASVNNIRLPKTAVMNLDQQKQLFASCDEYASEIMLQELPSFGTVQRFKAANQPIHDVKYAHVSGRGLLGFLSEDRMQLFSTIRS